MKHTSRVNDDGMGTVWLVTMRDKEVGSGWTWRGKKNEASLLMLEDTVSSHGVKRRGISRYLPGIVAVNP